MMLESLMFSLPRIAPFFLLIVLGIGLRRLGGAWVSFFEMANKFTFLVALPVNMFLSIASSGDSVDASAMRLFWYAMISTVVMFGLIWAVTELLYKDKTKVGTLVQGAFRGNYVLLGVPIVGAVAGPGAEQLAAFMTLAVIPAYNALSVVALTVRGAQPGKPSVGRIAKGIFTNPLIIAILVSLPFCFLGLPIPSVAEQTLGYVGQCATPLGLLSVGALFRLEDATACVKPALYATLIKLLVGPALAIGVAWALGFGGIELLLLLVIFASPTAISTFPMALSMGGDGPLASNILIFTTLLSAFVMAGGITLLRMWGIV